jgi:hypothetical protein
MDTAKRHVSDGRAVTLTIANEDDGIKVTITTRKADGRETTTEFSSKLNGKPSDFAEGSHKSQIIV